MNIVKIKESCEEYLNGSRSKNQPTIITTIIEELLYVINVGNGFCNSVSMSKFSIRIQNILVIIDKNRYEFEYYLLKNILTWVN